LATPSTSLGVPTEWRAGARHQDNKPRRAIARFSFPLFPRCYGRCFGAVKPAVFRCYFAVPASLFTAISATKSMACGLSVAACRGSPARCAPASPASRHG
jgi:hypothetical protein